MAAASNFRGTYQINDNPQKTQFFLKICISPSSEPIWDEFKMYKLYKKTGQDAVNEKDLRWVTMILILEF